MDGRVAQLLLALRVGARVRRRSPGEDRERLACDACGHIVYVNPRLVVTTFPITDAGEIVLIRRGIEPGKGSWAQPGGFLEVDETVHEAAIRETWEETGLLVEPGEIIGLYTRLEAIGRDHRVRGPDRRRDGRADPRGDRDRGLRAGAIPWSGIAFKTTTIALRDWFERRHPEIEVPAISPGR